MEKLYTIGDASKIVGLSASTIRFYEKNGLLPHMTRSSNGIRMFTEDDFEWIRLLEKLKLSGMPIREMREYVELYEQGDATLENRQRIVHERKAAVEEHMKELERSLDFITYKCWYYDKALELGSEQAVKDIPFEELPEDIQQLKKRCKIVRY